MGASVPTGQPPGTRRVAVLALGVVVASGVLPGCTRQEPDVTLEEQVPAEARTGDGGEPAEPGTPAPDAQELEFVAVDIDYSDAPSEAAPGPATLTLVNEGNLVHNVAFDELGGDEVVEADGGETASGDVEFEAGTYTYFCTVPGHRAAGMEGTLTVAGP